MANTGRLEKLQQDENQASATFGQTRWVDAGYNTTACPLPASFSSALIQEDVQRTSCPDGQFGSLVRFTMPAGAYTSTQSQLDANNQARTAFDAAKQDYANANGTCSNNPGDTTTWLPVYLSSGCFACQMVNRDDASDRRAADSNEIGQYYRPTAGQVSCTACADL
ncbi:DUF5977 domain-containing protein [Hymenobacter lapidiphilus]|uniref:DUF5977 domain-containing protein n=1 Tax=Hymenobacter lapidiphilus TaxID=2608003 RepID=A0A7Y7PSG1_9BACT|nr:DUF5977 domain-containing protein [Hymenobacter lapidiphilus]NVO33203.1 hypothetical protein [Hymenobacter lapidiphilus]